MGRKFRVISFVVLAAAGKDISQALEFKKNTCTLGAISQDECFSFLQLVPPDA